MKTLTLLLSVLSLLVATSPSYAKRTQAPTDWEYDAGPAIDNDVDSKNFQQATSKMDQELIEINSEIPYFPGVSQDVMGAQKFRPAYGPISWRMLLEPNSVKILFIGQDGTHIAEAAGRPATAGFGGRAHDLANHFGVDYSAAFINTYAFTIRGQYGDRGVPYLKNGKINFTSQYLDNELWMISQDQSSPIVQWRNKLIDWIIRNNKDSLKMIVTFGGSARDTISAYVESKDNGEVGTRLKYSDMKKIRMPEYKLQYAGGNNNFPTPLDRNGKDLYRSMLGKLDYTSKSDQMKAQKAIKADFNKVKDDMVFSNGGIDKSGLLHPAQLGGYDINKIKVDGKTTSGKGRVASLKGLKLNDGTKIPGHIVVVDLPHPTYLSMVAMEKGGRDKVKSLVKSKTEKIRPYLGSSFNWEIEPDFKSGKTKFSSNFASNKDYEYGRGEIGQEYYDFGTPGNRMVSKSSAKRIDASTILLGARDDKFLSKRNKKAMSIIDEMKKAEANELPSNNEMFISISRLSSTRTDFDPGPGAHMAEIMKKSLYGTRKANLDAIFKSKSKAPVSVEAVADFGHYRGRLDYAQALIVADPQGWDDIITARALTGTRGQYLQGLMNNFTEFDGTVGELHAVIKTVPFGMEGATSDQWKGVLEKTQEYRDAVLEEVLAVGKTQVIITDGEHAKAEVARFLAGPGKSYNNIKVVNIDRTSDNEKDMMNAVAALSKAGFEYDAADTDYEGAPENIPSSHLSYYARVWEGTSGDRVIDSETKPGEAFAQVVPDWVVKQRFRMGRSTNASVDKLVDTLYDNCLPSPGEKPQDFLTRKARGNMPKHCL